MKIYLKDTGLNSDEFAHRFIESELPSNLSVTGYNYIYIPNAEKKLIEMKILTEEESQLFIQMNIFEKIYFHILFKV